MKTPQAKSESARYWEAHLLSWEAAAYFKEGQKGANWWDKLSALFRGDVMYARMSATLELVKPHIAGKTVPDVGCESGRFVFQMIQAGAVKDDLANFPLEEWK